MTLFEKVREAVLDIKAGVNLSVVEAVYGPRVFTIAKDCVRFS